MTPRTGRSVQTNLLILVAAFGLISVLPAWLMLTLAGIAIGIRFRLNYLKARQGKEDPQAPLGWKDDDVR